MTVLEWTATGSLALAVISAYGAVQWRMFKYLTSIEVRLTRIETHLGIDMSDKSKDARRNRWRPF